MQYLIPLLTVIFVIAKITGHLAWSWWWVFSPLWIGIPVALCVIFLGAVLIHLAK
jgi:hypothetical protein